MADTFSKDLIAFVETMPAFPKSVQRIIHLTSDVNASAKEIVRVIESDPIMTAKILKALNSSYYSTPQKITSIQRALIHIGLNTIKNLALGIASIGVLNPKNKADFDTNNFLLHSLTTAAIAKRLAEKLNTPSAELSNFYVAGLLHDLGKIIFSEFDPENFKRALQYSTDNNISLHLAEIEFLGINHAQAGKLLAETWKLDQALIIAIAHHHDFSHKNALNDCVFIANQISKKISFGYAGNPIIEPMPAHIFARFELSLEELVSSLGDLSIIKNEALSFIKS